MPMNLDSVKVHHAELLAALLLCEVEPNNEHAPENRVRELRRDIKRLERIDPSLERARIMEMAARLHTPDAESEA